MSLSSSNGVTTSASTSHSRPPPTRPPRKRKHSSNSNSHSSKQQKFTYNSEKQSGIKDHLTVIDTDMAQQPPNRSFSAPTGTNNHKISLSNHAKGGGNNHTKKQGQGKKLVIKNLKGMLYFGICLYNQGTIPAGGREEREFPCCLYFFVKPVLICPS